MYCDLIAQHYAAQWVNQGEPYVWSGGRRTDLPAAFSVHRFPPTGKRGMWTYATVCMSQESDAKRLELHLFSPVASAAQVELLTATAHYHRTTAPLDLGHTVNFGRPWLPGSLCTHGLISLPFLDGPDLEILKVGDITTRFLWLVPITKREVEFKKEHGIEALETRLEEAQFDYLDPRRKSVV